MFSATIPEKIFFKAKKRTKRFNFENNWINLPVNNKYQKKATCFHKFYDWQVELFSSDDPEHKRSRYIPKNGFIEFRNDPIKLYLVGYKSLGRVYDYKKHELVVRTKEGYTFPIGHDVFINAVLNGGIKPGGEMPGKYVFARFQRTVKPIQVDSGIYDAIVELRENKKKEKINIRNMQVGHVYSTASGNAALFLGFVNTESMIVDTPPDAERFYMRREHSSQDPVVDFGVRFRSKKLLSLWMELGNVNELVNCCKVDYVEQKLSENLQKGHQFLFAVKQNHRYNNLVHKEKINVPDDIIMQIRSVVSRKLLNRIESDRNFRANPNNYLLNSPNLMTTNPPDKLRHFDAVTVAENSQTANMVPYGMKPIRSEPCSLFEQWVTKKNKFKRDKK